VQSVAGWAAYNETRLQQLRDPIGWGSYLLNADFWARTLQNWQSEFLAVGSFAVLAIYLRQRVPGEQAGRCTPRGDGHRRLSHRVTACRHNVAVSTLLDGGVPGLRGRGPQQSR
jgi:hypothetical protein